MPHVDMARFSRAWVHRCVGAWVCGGGRTPHKPIMRPLIDQKSAARVDSAALEGLLYMRRTLGEVAVVDQDQAGVWHSPQDLRPCVQYGRRHLRPVWSASPGTHTMGGITWHQHYGRCPPDTCPRIAAHAFSMVGVSCEAFVTAGRRS